MARARAAASLSFTIGIALATLVAGAGILAGPALLDCSHQPQSFGACLRGKVVDSGLLPPEPAQPLLVSSEEPTPRAPGWIEANATEYDAPATGAAQLRAKPGRLDAVGALPGSEVGGDIALVDPGTGISAAGLAPSPARTGDAELSFAGTGSIIVSAARAEGNGLVGGASVEPSVLPAPPEASGRVGIATRGGGRASLAPQLVADLSPVPPLAEVVAPSTPKAPPQFTRRIPASPKAAAVIRPAASPEPRAPKYDPRYPSVLVLPPPNTGKNSSFATLELR